MRKIVKFLWLNASVWCIIIGLACAAAALLCLIGIFVVTPWLGLGALGFVAAAIGLLHLSDWCLDQRGWY